MDSRGRALQYLAELDAADRGTGDVERRRPQGDAHHVRNDEKQSAAHAGLGR